MKPTAILSMDIRYHKTGMETRANPVLFDMPDFVFRKSIADFRCPQTAKEDEICFFAGFAGEKTLLGLRGLKSENHKSLPVSRKAFVVSNNGRIYIGRGVG